MTEIISIATAARTTLTLALSAMILGFILGMGFAALESARYRCLALVGTGLVTLLRSLPEILIVLFIYFGTAQLLIILTDGVILQFGEFCIQLISPIDDYDLSPLFCGITALGLLSAAYISQILRDALKAVAQGQWESGLALGMSNGTTFFRVILPQMWRYALPGLGNQWLILLKDTALVSLISVNDLMLQIKTIVSFTQQPFIWYLLAAGIYLIITLFSQMVLGVCERYVRYFDKRRF